MLDSISFAWHWLRQFLQCVVVFVGALVLAGCAGTRSAYQFQPPARSVAASDTLLTGTAPAPGLTSTPVPSLPRSGQPRRVRQAPQMRRSLARPQQVAAMRQLLARRPTLARSAAQATRPHRVQPQQPQEVGLGTTVLGVLGLVVLPLSLLGLLIWGGPVWAVLALLAALAILVAWLDPFA